MSVIQRQIKVGWQLRVFFTENVFAENNLTLKNALADAQPRKALVVIENSLSQATPGLEKQIEDYFSRHAKELQLVRSPLPVVGGEHSKNSIPLVTELLSQIDRHHIDRQSYLVAVGGGALLDLAGFAAAIAHRGVRHVRIPTTTLAQADSGVGVKNAINAFGKKNFIGTFAPPHAIINDFKLLATLPARDKRAGYVEAVKVACIRAGAFFADIEHNAEKLMSFEPDAMKQLIRHCAELHLAHIATGGDPFEKGSARPLDFGHWSAHKLEQISNFTISHAEAVAIGIAMDVIYSRLAGMLKKKPCERILNLLERLGFTLYAHELADAGAKSKLRILDGLEEFREHLGGKLTITLLKDIGRTAEVHEMNPKMIVAAIHELRDRRK
ncbi:MAG TPA: 3-dehydroquinate synthase [Verrucomicrobiae bacterium]|jgi:3-dehydroquinate synthase|nr:3-dehydroquinate synthase [Verrucomicrobiae bacterium]